MLCSCRGSSLALLLFLRASAAFADVVERAVSAGSDDAEQASDGSVFLASGDLELVVDTSVQEVGLRWTGVAVPPGRIVTAAWVQFRTDETGSGAASLTIRGEASANAATFTHTTGSISSRPRTAQAVNWSPPAWTSLGQAGSAQRTPDLSPVIQAIIDRPGWSSGNALVLIITGSGKRVADSFEGDYGPRLHVEFGEGDTPPQLSLTSPANDAVFAEGEAITFTATATDAEDGNLASDVLFSSNLDGPLGSGSPLVRSDLSPGGHVITASVTDSSGNRVARSVEILVTAAPALVYAAGDIATSGSAKELTAQVLDANPTGIVLTLGDNAYGSGTLSEFNSRYHPTWGRHVVRTFPSVGNHDYDTEDGAGYDAYFRPKGRPIGELGKHWYSFDYGGWHFVALNSNCSAAGGCGRSSPQGQWLEADLDAHPSRCTLAYWHHPRFSSSSNHGSSTATRELWAILDEHDADLVLAGHDHTYERFAPQDAEGRADPQGIREFVVGTGGAGLYEMGDPEPNSEVRNDSAHGVLELALSPDAYAWTFLPVEGDSFTDSGTARCVGTGRPVGCGLGPELLVVLLALLTRASGSRSVGSRLRRRR